MKKNIFVMLLFFLFISYHQVVAKELSISNIFTKPENLIFYNNYNPKKIDVYANFTNGTQNLITNNINYNSSNKNIVTISTNGTVYPHGFGEAVLIIKYDNFTSYIKANIVKNDEYKFKCNDSDLDGILDYSDPFPNIATKTSTGLILNNFINTIANFNVIGSISVSSQATGSIYNYYLQSGAKVQGHLKNNSSQDLKVIGAYLIAPENNNIGGSSFVVAGRRMDIIGGTQDASLLGNGLLESGESIGLVANINQYIDLRGYGIRWLWIIDTDVSNLDNDNMQIWIISDPPIISNYDEDGILDDKDIDDDNDGVPDLKEIKNGKDFLNSNDQPLKANFKASDLKSAQKQNIYFYNLSTGYIKSCTWSFGDGNNSTKISPVYSYKDPGTYNVVLKISNGDQNSQIIKHNYILITRDRGDINGDGQITLKDAVLALQMSIGDTGQQGKGYTNADVDGDGKINMKEVSYILEHIVQNK